MNGNERLYGAGDGCGTYKSVASDGAGYPDRE